MTTYNYCPMCSEPLSKDNVVCKNCGYVLDEDTYNEKKNELERLIKTNGLFVELPAPFEELTYQKIIEILSFQFMVESDMNTSSDFNPDGKINYHDR